MSAPPLPVSTLADQAVDDILGTLGLSADEKLKLAHRLIANVAQTRAGTDSGRQLQLVMLQLRQQMNRTVQVFRWRRA